MNTIDIWSEGDYCRIVSTVLTENTTIVTRNEMLISKAKAVRLRDLLLEMYPTEGLSAMLGNDYDHSRTEDKASHVRHE